VGDGSRDVAERGGAGEKWQQQATTRRVIKSTSLKAWITALNPFRGIAFGLW
jgi:hypothetical protein